MTRLRQGVGVPGPRPRPARLSGLAVPLALAAALAGCGRGSDAPDADVAVVPPVQFAAEIASVAAGADGRSIVARVDALPEDGATGPCEIEVSHSVELEDDRIYLGVTYLTHDPEQAGVFTGCPTAPREVTVDLGAPLDGRHVITQDPTGRWVPGAEGAYALCELPACDAATGATPLPATCDDSTLADAARSGDVPRHAGLGPSRCELPWAVIDIDVGAGACPATGEGPDPCAGENVRRTYWRTAGYTWRQVGSSAGSGCGEIATIVPEFPLHLCADLPPLP